MGYLVGNPLPSLLCAVQWRHLSLSSFRLNEGGKNSLLLSAYLLCRVLKEPEQKEGAPRAWITKLPRHQGFPPRALAGKKKYLFLSFSSSCKFAKQKPGCGPWGNLNLNKAALMISGDGQGNLGIT